MDVDDEYDTAAAFNNPSVNCVHDEFVRTSQLGQQQQQQHQSSDISPWLAVELRDVIPCNLRLGSRFLHSVVHLWVDRTALYRLLHCYGFLMYDRDAKVQELSRSSNDDVRAIAEVLATCRDIDDFCDSLTEHIRQIREFMTDDVAEALGTAAASTGQQSKDVECESEKELGRRILHIARNSLDMMLTYLRDTDELRRHINANEYCRQLFARDASDTVNAIREAWYNRNTCDMYDCLSIIVRDMIVSSGMETHTTFLFVMRATLLLTFLMVNTICARSHETRIRILRDDEVAIVADAAVGANNDAVADAAFDQELIRNYMNSCNEITPERLIATVAVTLARMYFANLVEWPCKLAENDGGTVNLGGSHNSIIRALTSTAPIAGSSTFRWLRVMRRRAELPPARLYVNGDAILALLERLSACVDASDVVNERRASTSTSMNGVDATERKVVLRGDTKEFKRQWLTYCDEADVCARAIAENLRTRDHSIGVQDYVLRPEYIHRRRRRRRSMSRPSSTDDNARAASEMQMTDSLSDSDLEHERHIFANDVGRMLLHSVLALVRYDTRSKCYDTVYAHLPQQSYTHEQLNRDAPVRTQRSRQHRNDHVEVDDEGYESDEGSARQDRLEFDETNESYRILMLHTLGNFYRSKASLSQMKQFFDYMVNMWNDRIGLAELEQLSEILLTMYRMFPCFNRTNNNDDGARSNELVPV